MIPEGTLRRRCVRCKRVVLVPAVIPCENRWALNGIWLIDYDENYNEKNVGVLCFECAFTVPWERSTIPDLGDLGFSLGFGGGNISDLDLWEAVLEAKKNVCVSVCS